MYRRNPGSVSIPFDQGNVFRRDNEVEDDLQFSVSIPFDQGNVFRPYSRVIISADKLSQSLSIRAMSFDR